MHVPRPSPRPLRAVFHRDVGALQLLRHAGAARAVHARSLQIQPARGLLRLQVVHQPRLPDAASGRFPRRPLSRQQMGRHHRRHPHGDRPILAHVRAGVDSLLRAGVHDPGQRLLQAEHVHAGRPALSAKRSAPRWRLHHFLHGHQSRRLPVAAGVRLAGAEHDRRTTHRLHGGRHRHAAGLVGLSSRTALGHRAETGAGCRGAGRAQRPARSRGRPHLRGEGRSDALHGPRTEPGLADAAAASRLCIADRQYRPGGDSSRHRSDGREADGSAGLSEQDRAIRIHRQQHTGFAGHRGGIRPDLGVDSRLLSRAPCATAS